MLEVWAPTPELVADHLRHFTRGRGGTELGTFTDETVPTLTEVETAIARTVEEVEADAGPIDVTLYALAGDVASVGAASAVIIDRSSDLSRELWERYQARMKTLRRAASRRGGRGTVGSVGVRTALTRASDELLVLPELLPPAA